MYAFSFHLAYRSGVVLKNHQSSEEPLQYRHQNRTGSPVMASPYVLPGSMSRFEFGDPVYHLQSPPFSDEGSTVSTQGSDGSTSDSRPTCMTDCVALRDFNAVMEPYGVQRYIEH